MNTKLIGIAMGVVAIMGISGTALAYHGDYQVKGPNATPEREAQMTQAMTTNDYTLWKTLMGDRGRVTEVVTQQNFARFAEAWKLGKAGDAKGASAIRAELGLGAKDGAGQHSGAGRGNGMHRGEGARGMHRN